MGAKTAIKLPSESVRYAKSHALYWKQEGRLFTQHGSPNYCCRFSHNGKRGFFDLNTPNKVEAQKRAAERYKYVVAHGWDAANRNPEFRTQPREPKEKILTVGGWINEVTAVLTVQPITLRSYAQTLRRLAAEAVLGLDYSPKAHKNWLSKVDAVPLSRLNANAVAKWIKKRLDEAKGNPKAQEQATHTINHILRSARALFSPKKVIPLVPVEVQALLPQPLPLSDVRLLEEDSSARFTPEVDPEELLRMAHQELGAPQGEGEDDTRFFVREQQWIAFLLSFFGGLRRKEADLLMWQQMQLDHPNGPRIQLEVTCYFNPKNKAHAKGIPLEPEVAEIFRAYRQRYPDAEFVLQSDRKADATGLKDPRCEWTWNQLMTWLRSKGITDRKPIHSLRKAVGALMAEKHGIQAAQRHLRHTSPAITSKYYSDSEARHTPGIGGLLSGGGKG